MIVSKEIRSMFPARLSAAIEADAGTSKKDPGARWPNASESLATTNSASSKQGHFARYFLKKPLQGRLLGSSTPQVRPPEISVPPPDIRKESYETRLSWCIDRITEPKLLIDKPRELDIFLSELVEERPHCTKARLWLAVLQRIYGKNPSKEFRSILKDEPDNRLALLNLCVTPLTWHPGLSEPDDDDKVEKMRNYALRRIEQYLLSFPTDPFARLIECHLIDRITHDDDKLWEKLNALYLDEPNYSAVLSTMAVACSIVTLRASAEDFGREAFAKCPNNWQAVILLQKFGQTRDLSSTLESQIGYASSASISTANTMTNIFSCPYSIQDPQWPTTNITLE